MIYRCPQCGSDRLQSSAWIWLNSEKFESSIENERGDPPCDYAICADCMERDEGGEYLFIELVESSGDRIRQPDDLEERLEGAADALFWIGSWCADNYAKSPSLASWDSLIETIKRGRKHTAPFER